MIEFRWQNSPRTVYQYVQFDLALGYVWAWAWLIPSLFPQDTHNVVNNIMNIRNENKLFIYLHVQFVDDKDDMKKWMNEWWMCNDLCEKSGVPFGQLARVWLDFLKHSQHAVPSQIFNGQDSWPKGTPDSVLCPLLSQPLQELEF